MIHFPRAKPICTYLRSQGMPLLLIIHNVIFNSKPVSVFAVAIWSRARRVHAVMATTDDAWRGSNSATNHRLRTWERNLRCSNFLFMKVAMAALFICIRGSYWYIKLNCRWWKTTCVEKANILCNPNHENLVHVFASTASPLVEKKIKFGNFYLKCRIF